MRPYFRIKHSFYRTRRNQTVVWAVEADKTSVETELVNSWQYDNEESSMDTSGIDDAGVDNSTKDFFTRKAVRRALGSDAQHSRITRTTAAIL